MGEANVGDNVQAGQKVDLEAERKRREQAPRPRQKGAAPTRTQAANTTALEAKLKDFYSTAIGAMYFVDSDVAEFQSKHVDRLAVTQAAWARDNPFVRRFLEALTSGGVAGAAIIEGVLVIGGSLMIVQAKRGELDVRLYPAAAMLGIDLPTPVIRPDVTEPEEPENPYDVTGNGGGLEGVRLGEDEEEQVASD